MLSPPCYEIDVYLRRMFEERLARHQPGQPLPELRIVWVDMPERNCIRLKADLRLSPFDTTQPRRAEHERLQHIIRDPDLVGAILSRYGRPSFVGGLPHDYDAHGMWSELVEDHLMRLELRVVQENLSRVLNVLPPGSEQVRQAQEMYRHQVEHIRHHFAGRGRTSPYYSFAREVLRSPVLASPYSIAPGDWTVTTETIPTAIQPLPRHEQARLAMQMQQQMNAALQAQFAQFVNPETWNLDALLGDQEAHKKGAELLETHLSPAQKETYKTHKYFDVVGGETGKTYRIHHGRQMNIHEIDKDGRQVCGWCFVPQGNLVHGDVMLAQKTALELYEKKALKIANRFPPTADRTTADEATFGPVGGAFQNWLRTLGLAV